MWESEQCSDTPDIMAWFKCFEKGGILNKNRAEEGTLVSAVVFLFKSSEVGT